MKQKQVLLLPLFFLLLGQFSFAQTQFPHKDGVWVLEHEPQQDWPEKYFFDPISVEKDTLIKGLTYSIIDYSNIRIPIRCALRNDYPKVYLLDLIKHDTIESVIYDFSLKTGDTIRTPNIHIFDDSITWRVGKIDFIEIKSVRHKRMYLFEKNFHDNGHYWIEGIGSTFGPLYPLWGPTFESRNGLTCYSEGGECIYGNCNYLGIESYADPGFQFDFNAQTKHFFIKDLSNETMNFTLFNLMGSKVYEVNHCGEQEIDLSFLGKGIYIVALQSGTYSFSQKIIIN